MALVTSINWISVVIAGFASSILFSSFVTTPPLVAVLLLVVAGAIYLAERVWHGGVEREIVIFVVFVACFGLGVLRYAVKEFHLDIEPESVGLVVEEPEHKEGYTQFVFESINGVRALVRTDIYSAVQYGDEVELSGKFTKPISSPDFDYANYLAKDNIYFTNNSYELKVLQSRQGSWLKHALFDLKNSFINQAKSLWPEPESSLLGGLIVAGRDALPKSVLDEFRGAGVVHIVVLSGFNITIIAEFLRRVSAQLLVWLGLTTFTLGPALLAVLGVILFVVMTGASATVVRAALMALTVILARFIGRGYSATRALILAGFVMLLFNPKLLAFDASFQLSFLATLGMIHFVPRVDKLILQKVSTKLPKLREIVSQTLGTQLAVLPLLLYSVGNFSPTFLPANVLILPVVPWVMLTGFIAVTLSYLSSWLAWPLTLVTHLLLKWILVVANLFGSF